MNGERRRASCHLGTIACIYLIDQINLSKPVLGDVPTMDLEPTVASFIMHVLSATHRAHASCIGAIILVSVVH